MNDSEKIHKIFIANARETVAKYNMFTKKDKVLAGISGGPDSVALLLFLIKVKEEYSLDIGIAHLNHMLRGDESDRDAEFVRTLAKKFDIPCFIEKKDVQTFAKEHRLSIEDGARKVRYSFLKGLLKEKQYSKIALGHNSDDNAEQILMNIIRGSGPKGLTGIQPIREDIIIRPLIGIQKKEVYRFLQSVDQAYVVDSSNSDNKFLRNSIRNYFIPLIEEKYNPKIKESLVRLSNIIKDEDDWMEKETEIVFNKALRKKELKNTKANISSPDIIELSIEVIQNSPSALRKRVLRNALKKINGSLKKITSKHIDDVIKLFLSSTSGESIDLPDKIRVFKEKSSLFFKKETISLRELGRKRKNKKK